MLLFSDALIQLAPNILSSPPEAIVCELQCVGRQQ